MNYGNKLELFFSVHPRLHRQLMFGELWVWSLWGGWTTSLQAVISCVVSLSALISGPLSSTEISVVLAVNANLMCCVSIVLVAVWYRLSTGGPEDMKAKNKAQCSALLKLCATLAVFWSLSAFIWGHTPTWFLQLESSLLKSMICRLRPFPCLQSGMRGIELYRIVHITEQYRLVLIIMWSFVPQWK